MKIAAGLWRAARRAREREGIDAEARREQAEQAAHDDRVLHQAARDGTRELVGADDEGAGRQCGQRAKGRRVERAHQSMAHLRAHRVRWLGPGAEALDRRDRHARAERAGQEGSSASARGSLARSRSSRSRTKAPVAFA